MLCDELFNMLLCGCDAEKITRALMDISNYSDRIKEKLDIYSGYQKKENVSDAIFEYVEKFGITEDIDLIYICLHGKYDISAVLGSPDADMKKCVYLCCRNIEGFYEAAENYPADLINNTDKAKEAEKFYDYCISMKLLDNENKTKEEKERLVSGLFKVKTEIAERTLNIGNGNTNSEFDKLALQIKSNIRNMIASGNIDNARKTLTEYQKLKPDDAEICELAALLEGKHNE